MCILGLPQITDMLLLSLPNHSFTLDFVVLARTHAEILAAKTEIINLLAGMDLEINSEKTRITNFAHGFCFLGHGFLDNAIFPIDTNKIKPINNSVTRPQSKQRKKKL